MAGEAPLDPHTRLKRDIGRHVRGAFLLAAVGLTLGVALMPRGDELLLIHVRGRDLAGARRVLAGQESSGISTVSSVVAHGELFLLEGRVDEALLDLEAFLKRNPGNASAWRRLARLYEHAQRLDDEVRALGEVYRLDPSPELARQLVALYRWAGNEAQEAERLRDLVRRADATSDETLRSARLDAALGRRDAALATIEGLAARDPEALDYPAVELFASLLVDAGRVATLSTHLQRLPLVRNDPAVLSQLAVTMRRWGWTGPAVRLFDTPRGHVALPTLLAGRAHAAEGTDLAPAVLRDLLRIDTTRVLTDEPREAALKLALSLHDDQAVDALLGRPARPAPAIVGLAIGDAVTRGAQARAQTLISRFGDEGLADSPLLALQLAVERADHTRALAWIVRMDAAGVSDPLEVAAIAQMEAKLGLETQAFDRLAKLVATGTAPGWAATDLATLGTQLSRVDEALKALAPEVGAAIEPERRRAWARLVAEQRRVDLVQAWLRSHAVTAADAPALRDIYYLLAECRELATASAVAERLVGLHASPDDAVLLAHAFTAAGRPRDALAPLRAAGLRSPEARGAYDTALARVLLGGGDDATGELRADAMQRLEAERQAKAPLERRRVLVEALYAAGERAFLIDDVLALAERDLDAWLSALVESANASGKRQGAATVITDAAGGLGRLDGSRRIDRVRALLELDAPDAVLLPELRRLADQDREGWTSIYDQRLARAGRTSEQIELWTAVGEEAKTPAELRRAAASRLADLGTPAGAAAVYERLAADAGPSDPDVQQLLALWNAAHGAHPEWLMARLRTAPSADRAAWMAHVVGAGGASLVATEFPDVPTGASPAFAQIWLDAHRASGDRDLFSRALAQAITWIEADTDTLRHAGRTALAENLPRLALDAYRLVASREPADREAARWVGTLSFYEHHSEEARQHLTSYEALGGDEPEPLFQLGELAREDRRPSDARGFYERSLSALTAPGTAAVDVAPAQRALLANVLVRLDERDRAVDAFGLLLRETPGSGHVRADFSAALLQWGKYDHAWRVLEDDSRAPSTGVDDGSARRLDLLRLQWLNFEGRYGDALQLVESLEARYPGDVDVRLARASFDAARGRAPQADAQYAAIVKDTPDRPDVAAIAELQDRQRAPRASMQLESREVSGAWSSTSTLVNIEERLSRQVPVTVAVERLDLEAAQVLTADGRIGPLSRTMTRFEAGLAAPLAPGVAVSAALFGTGSGIGAGGTFERHDLRGAWKATVEHGRPFWELVESAASDGRKDRVGIQRDWRFSADTAGWAVFDLNRYRLSEGASASTTALTLGFIRTVRHASPTLTLQYGVDKEHVRDATRTTAFDGRVFAPIPLVSREVHLAGAVTRFPIRRIWDVEASAGYTVDRFGGRGSFLTGRATPAPGSRIGLDIWGERRLYSLSTTQQALRGGVRVTLRF